MELGCSAAALESESDGLGAHSQPALITVNGLTAINGLTTVNGLITVNGLATTNGVTTVNGMITVNGLTTVNGFVTVDGLLEVDNKGKPTVFPDAGGLMNSASGRSLISYIVKCALKSNQSITRKDSKRVAYTFTGGIGLAPEWFSTSNGACGQACEEWVSACLLAHFNPTGTHENFVMVGANPAIGFDNPYKSPYEEKEAGFYGNVFMSPPKAYYCASVLNDARLDSRTCADDGNFSSCPMTPQGECSQDWPNGGAYTQTGREFDEVADIDEGNCDDGYCAGSAATSLGNTCGPDKDKMCVSEWNRIITTWVVDDP